MTGDESVATPTMAVIHRAARSTRHQLGQINATTPDCDPGQCGFCVLGCRHGGKQAPGDVPPDAQGAGRGPRIVANCQADPSPAENGRATGVDRPLSPIPTPRDAAVSGWRAKTYVCPCGAIQSPPSVLRSPFTIRHRRLAVPASPTWVLGSFPDHLGVERHRRIASTRTSSPSSKANYGFCSSRFRHIPVPSRSRCRGSAASPTAGDARAPGIWPRVVLAATEKAGARRESRWAPVIDYRVEASKTRLPQRGIVEARECRCGWCRKDPTLHTRPAGLVRATPQYHAS